MNPSTALITLIFIPALVISAIVFFIFKSRRYAMISIALYLFSSSIVVLSKDYKTSISFIIVGIITLLSGLLLKEKNKDVRKYVFWSSTILFILLLSTYSIVVSLDMVKLNSVTYKIVECRNETYTKMCKYEITAKIYSPIPITKTFYGNLCKNGISIYPIVVLKEVNGTYRGVVTIPENGKPEEICISSYRTYKCDDCLFKSPIS